MGNKPSQVGSDRQLELRGFVGHMHQRQTLKVKAWALLRGAPLFGQRRSRTPSAKVTQADEITAGTLHEMTLGSVVGLSIITGICSSRWTSRFRRLLI
jgi:hypothetical protein